MNLRILTKTAFACISGIAAVTTLMAGQAAVTMTSFGTLPDGRAAHLYTLTNARGAKVAVTNYGGLVTHIIVPDRGGRMADIALGYDCVEKYVKSSPYFGALIGRYGNRIAKGKFTLDGKTYTLAANNRPGGIPCTLHGGKTGFDKVLWDAVPLLEKNAAGLRLRYLSKDGEEGFPGNLDVTVTYWFNDENELRIEYLATTDKPTPVNLTNHSYFNLGGEDGEGTILGHLLTIHASKYTPVDAGLIPTGKVAAVAGTPFDFTIPRAVGGRLNADNEQLKFGGGYDHNFVLERPEGGLAKAAEVYDPVSGRVMEILTTEPALQFYAGQNLNGSRIGKSGRPYVRYGGIVLETQHFPDSPNQPAFPDTILRPGQQYETVTIYRFGTR